MKSSFLIGMCLENFIAGSIYDAADEDGHYLQILDVIINVEKIKGVVRGMTISSPIMSKKSRSLQQKDGNFLSNWEMGKNNWYYWKMLRIYT